MDSSSDLMRTEIQNAKPILKALDARLEAVEFDPLLASSVDAASAEVIQAIEELLASFRSNPILGPLAIDLKRQYLETIQYQVLEAKANAVVNNTHWRPAI